jgi:23S rRNA U2552 (ribose-2'-O)-methylase RlmE/FtsJ
MTNKNIISKYMPITINMQVEINSIFNYEPDVKLTSNIDYPKCSLGFHHFIHSLKKDTIVLDQFENKKKVYNIVNKFEIEIDKYDDSIKNKTIKYLNIKDTDIISIDFYKIWEILFMFDLFDVNSPIKTLHLAEDGSNIQSISFFKDKFGNNNKDTYYVNNLNNLSKNLKNVISFDNIDKINLNSIDLIMIGSKFNINNNENTIEQEYFKEIFNNIYYSIKVQKKGGNLILKLFETYTNVSTKFISIFVSLYEKVFFIKPMTSKPSISEKYLVCIGFKSEKLDEIIKKLEKIKNIIDANDNLKINDIFVSYNIDKKIKIRIIKLNEMISNKLFSAKGDMVNFVNGQDYYGDTYEKYREKQIEANNYWTETFLPDPSNFKEIKKQIVDASFLTNKINVDKALELEKYIDLN